MKLTRPDNILRLLLLGHTQSCYYSLVEFNERNVEKKTHSYEPSEKERVMLIELVMENQKKKVFPAFPF